MDTLSLIHVATNTLSYNVQYKYMHIKANLPEATLDLCLLNLSSSSGKPVI